MTSKEATDFVKEVFKSIKSSKSINDLQKIEATKFDKKFRMDVETYPKIDFKITKSEIELLLSQNVIDENFEINELPKDSSALIKLLYSLIWKNGDLKKIKHIIKGIYLSDESVKDQEKSFVFYQFGKYLTKEIGEPIIDQHVIRAYALYIELDLSKVDKIRELSVITKREKGYIESYINWLQSNELNDDLKLNKDYSYYIDRILFATGKKIKYFRL